MDSDDDVDDEGESVPSLSVAGHLCRPVGNLCFSCGAPWETKCPDIDDLKNKKG